MPRSSAIHDNCLSPNIKKAKRWFDEALACDALDNLPVGLVVARLYLIPTFDMPFDCGVAVRFKGHAGTAVV